MNCVELLVQHNTTQLNKLQEKNPEQSLKNRLPQLLDYWKPFCGFFMFSPCYLPSVYIRTRLKSLNQIFRNVYIHKRINQKSVGLHFQS